MSKGPKAICHHPATIVATETGKEAWRKVYRSLSTYQDVGINWEEWHYLGYLIAKGRLYADSIKEKYGTEGERIYQKLIDLDYVTHRPAYIT